MHRASYEIMQRFVQKYIGNATGVTVVDVGSRDYNGSYRDLFDPTTCLYIGADIVDGPNVDVLVTSGEWSGLKDVDYVISGQTMENVEDLDSYLNSMYRILKPGGYVCIISPSDGPVHHYPAWNGHFGVERMSELVEKAGFDIVDCLVYPAQLPFKDCCCIARKPSTALTALNSPEESDSEPEIAPQPIEPVMEDEPTSPAAARKQRRKARHGSDI